MGLDKPVCAYIAASNDEAWIVKNYLEQHGIPAHCTADVSGVGVWMLGIASQLCKPEVWVNEADREPAARLLHEYEQNRQARMAEFALDRQEAITVGTTIAECADCGKSTTFPATLSGSVQACPHCGKYLDVGEIDWPYDDDFGEKESAPNPAE